MEKEYILVYDSGVGGLTTLREIKNLLPNEKFLYFADDKNVPYGNKSKEKVYKLTKVNLNSLINRFKIKIIVLACNTLTASCIDRFRGEYNIDFVGVEPAILEAERISKSKQVLVLCTNLTSRQKRYKILAKKAKLKVYTLKLKTLAEDIENDLTKNKEICLYKYKKVIEKILSKHKGIDSLVLGCTHYSFLKNQLKKEFNLNVIDGNCGVARRVKSLIGKSINLNNKETLIILSSLNKSMEKNYNAILNALN